MITHGHILHDLCFLCASIVRIITHNDCLKVLVFAVICNEMQSHDNLYISVFFFLRLLHVIVSYVVTFTIEFNPAALPGSYNITLKQSER